MTPTLTKMLADARRGGYAVGSFSPRYTRMILPVVRAAIEMRSPAIVQISEKEIVRHNVDIAAFAREYAAIVDRLQPDVPISLHLDHTKTFDVIRQAIGCGFQSVMIDASEFPFEENVRRTREVVAYAHARDVAVEAELGKIGTTDHVETDSDEELYTDPAEAERFIAQTGADWLAVSVGTAHGIYTVKRPTIDYERLTAINARIDAILVLHGGSDVPADMIAQAVRLPGGGVCKVNIATDLEQAMLRALGKDAHISDALLDAYGDADLERARSAVQAVVMEKMARYVLSAGRA